MSMTLTILNAIVEKLNTEHGKELAVEFFPEQPATYRLNHPTGAILVSYSRSQFNRNESTDSTWMARELTIPLTLMFRQLNGKTGVIAWLDRVRGTLTGWYPPNCDYPLKPVSEQFLMQNTGIWQYALDFTTSMNQIQAITPTPPGSEFPAHDQIALPHHLRYEAII